uniref:Rho-GAP domain-containing protein n=1 Tax=Callorhinchus milii TaxID=7868 RepID=A0A4W3HYS1_CALMI
NLLLLLLLIISEYIMSTDTDPWHPLLRLYLRQLPEPVIPFAKYKDFLCCAQPLAGHEEEVFLLRHMYCLFRFLDEVQTYSSVNKMSIQNRATVFGPNILRPKVNHPETVFGGTALVQQLMSIMINEHSDPFLHNVLKATSVGQDAKSFESELTASSPISNRETTKNLPLHTEVGQQASSFGAPNDVLNGNFTIQLHGDKSVNHPLLNKAGIQTTAAHVQSDTGTSVTNTSNIWNEKQRDDLWESGESTYKSKLSMYDNITVSLVNTEDVQSDHSPPWSTSSCEISLDDHFQSSGTTCPEEELERSSSELSITAPLRPETPGNTQMPEFAFGYSGSSENNTTFVSLNDPSYCALRGFAATFKRKLVKQKEQYETRIEGLEKRHQELEQEVQNLHLNLNQQRICYDIARIKLRNIERAREDAEKRNDKLQMEMEQFFDTFGDLDHRHQDQ